VPCDSITLVRHQTCGVLKTVLVLPGTVLQVMHCSVPAGHKCELVVDPGPGVLLVVSGTGKAMVRAGAVSDELVLDETDLQPGEAGAWDMPSCIFGGGVQVGTSTAERYPPHQITRHNYKVQALWGSHMLAGACMPAYACGYVRIKLPLPRCCWAA
jgi:hypothetical protein